VISSINIKNNLWFFVAILVTVISGIFFSMWVFNSTNRELRKNLLQKAELVAPAINFDHIKVLTGSEADLTKPDYAGLKQQFSNIRSADPDFRFIYLLGRNTEGKIFFFVDNENPDSKDYSFPGQLYDDASDELITVFDSGKSFVEGPVQDEWGVWVSTLVPITDPVSRKVVAVMGMDIDAGKWKWLVFSKSIMSSATILLIVLLLIMILHVLQSTSKLKENEEKYRRFFATSRDGTFMTSIEGKILDANDSAVRLFGYADETDLFKANILDFYTYPEDRRIFSGILIEKGYAEAYPVLLKKKDGTPVDCMVTAVIVKDLTEKPVAIQGTIRDVTEKKRDEMSIWNMNRELSAMVGKLEDKNTLSKTVSELREYLSASSSVSEIGPVITRYLKKLFPQSDGALFLISPSKTDLETIAIWGNYSDNIDENVMSPDDCWGLRRGINYIVADSKSEVPCNHIKDPENGVLYACFPLIAKNEIIGLLHIRCRSHSTYDAEKKVYFKETAEALTALLSLAISNLRLNEKLSMLSIKDALTGLFNRRYIEETFIRESVRAKRNKSSIGIIMADIDHFKKFNDIHGHAAGDAVLKQISKFLSSSIRGCDIVCRYGGEEFVLMLPDADLCNTFLRAQNLVEKAKNMQFDFNGITLGPVTLSMGVSAYPEKGEKLEELLRVADIALYKAKQEGRDRAVSS
jgi:diguanylate cyclase (GGDEF)-like protein/PAS domain S-box-containing protein